MPTIFMVERVIDRRRSPGRKSRTSSRLRPARLLLEVHLIELGIELGRQVEQTDVVRRDGTHRAAL